MKALFPALLAFLFLPTWGLAQDSSNEGFEETLEVREVLLDVLVTDGDGNVIVGLEKEDFLVEEDGRTVKIERASFYSSRQLLGTLATEGGHQPEETPPPEDRYFALVFFRPIIGGPGDNRLFLRLPEAGKKAFEWVVQELQPNDHVAVLGFDTALRLHHDFTRDPDRLGRAIQRATTGKKADQRWPSRTESPAHGISLASLPHGEASLRETADIYKALEVLATGLGTVRGRKNIILFGADLPASGSPSARTDFDDMVQRLNRHNVAVYSISVVGRGRQDSLDRLAQETGGEHLFSFRNFLAPLRDIARQNSGYYLLSFLAEHHSSESGYRRVAVSTANKEFQVRSRGGYSLGE